jgi:predicted anti-sigma-YlaC factor YlaD
MRLPKECAALRSYLQDCLDRGADPEESRISHLRVCPECRAWKSSLAAAAGELRAALEAETAALPPLQTDALRALRAAHTTAARARTRRRLSAVAALLMLAVGLGTAVGLKRRRLQLQAARAESGSEYLVELIFTTEYLEGSNLGLALTGNGNGGWTADTLQSGELYSMEPLTLF